MHTNIYAEELDDSLVCMTKPAKDRTNEELNNLRTVLAFVDFVQMLEVC